MLKLRKCEIMIEFLQNNIASLIVILVILLGMFIGIKAGYEKQVKQFLLYLVIKAEKEFGGSTGELKFAAVASWIYEKLPSIARIFISSADIEDLIEDAVIVMKKYLAENEKAKAIVENTVEQK